MSVRDAAPASTTRTRPGTPTRHRARAFTLPPASPEIRRTATSTDQPSFADELARFGGFDDPIYRHPARGRTRLRGNLFGLVVGIGAGASIAAALLVTWSATSDLGGWLTLGGSVSAMLGTYLALVAVMLSSRLPWLEREVGHDRMIIWHRTVGPAALFLIVAHVVLTTMGWAIAEGVGPVDEFVGLILGYEWMMPALAAFIIMVALGLSSMRRVRRKMKYETWHAAHMYFYLAIVLAYGHAVAFGPMFSEYPVIATAWLALYVAVFGTIIVFRFLAPAWTSMRHRLVVEEVVEESPGVISVYISGRNLDRLKVRGGQFFAWRFLARGMWTQAHPYSLSAGHHPECLRLTVKALGDYSAKLATLRPGTRVVAEGPYGVFTAERRHSNTVVGIAAGVGITPIRALLDDLPDHADVTVIYRVRDERDLALRAELDDVAYKTGWRIVYLTGGDECHAMTPELLFQHAPRLARADVFLCGPPFFANLALKALHDAGVKKAKIHHEQFAF